MTTIVKTIEIDAPASDVWDKIADTAGISNLIGFVTSSTQTGNTRVCQLEGGGNLKETIASVDHDLRRVAYSITDSPLGMEFHAASMQVEAHNGKARFIWTVDVLPEDAKEHLTPLLDNACADMKATLAA